MSATPKWNAWLASMIPAPGARYIVEKCAKISADFGDGFFQFEGGKLVRRKFRVSQFVDGVALDHCNVVLGEPLHDSGAGEIGVSADEHGLKHQALSLFWSLRQKIVGHIRSFLKRGAA